MKLRISPLPEVLSFLNSVREKREGDGDSGHPQYEQQPKKEKSKDPSTEITPEAVEVAIDAFSAEVQSKTYGLNASMVGTGPGLKVVLRDGTGAVIRQFTGEEFLKLREAASKDTHSRGKILDQKL